MVKTRKELAELLNVTVKTLSNWEKDKPELVRLINLGLATDDYLEELKELIAKIEEIKEETNQNKLKIKK